MIEASARARSALHTCLPNQLLLPAAGAPIPSCCPFSCLPSDRYEPSALEVAREVPLPSLEELGGYLPSQRFPSDHLPVVFDLRFRPEGASADVGSSSSSSGAGAGAPAGSRSGSGEAASPGAGNLLPAALHNVGTAADALQRDEVIAVPTDTLYGLASCANSSRAVRHIYATKRRQDHKPLAIAVADVADVPRYGDTQVGVEGRGRQQSLLSTTAWV